MPLKFSFGETSSPYPEETDVHKNIMMDYVWNEER
jgi:hypothetical protein